MNCELEHERLVALVNAALAGAIRGDGRLRESMRYSLGAGGKRVRPVLMLAFGGEAALPFAAAIEMIHTYSLIHDDLPGMDDDDLRRGRPTNHIAFGESTAIVAGDALQAHAFEIMLDAAAKMDNPLVGIKSARIVAAAAGCSGMCGGQVMDMENEVSLPDLERLRNTCALKTGALITAACCAGAVMGGRSDAEVEAAKRYGEDIGLAFQIVDDMLDRTADQTLFGKPTGSDEKRGKATFAELLGVEMCREMAAALTESAKAAVASIDNAEFLNWFADGLARRIY